MGAAVCTVQPKCCAEEVLSVQKEVKMDFLKKIVPTVASGDVVLEVGSSVRENSPRLLKMRRVSLLSLGQTIDEDQEIHVLHPHFCMYPCHQADN